MRKEAVVQRLDREGVGEAADARRDRLARLREGALAGAEGRREALAQPLARGMEHERARRIDVDVDFTGVEKTDFAVSLRHDDGRIGERLELVLRSELRQYEAPEAPLEESDLLTLDRLVPHA